MRPRARDSASRLPPSLLLRPHSALHRATSQRFWGLASTLVQVGALWPRCACMQWGGGQGGCCQEAPGRGLKMELS